MKIKDKIRRRRAMEKFKKKTIEVLKGAVLGLMMAGLFWLAVFFG